MAKYHWSFRNEARDGRLLETVKWLEWAGYDSALVQFQVHSGDPFILATYMAANSNNLKFIVALRPYALSPAYCKMQCNIFERLFGNRLSLNIVAGTFDEENAVFLQKHTQLEDRKYMVRDFVYELSKLNFDNDSKPMIAITGSSETSLATVREAADMSIMLMSDFVNAKTALQEENFRKCIKISLVIRDTEAEAEKAWSQMKQFPREVNDVICGTHESIKKKILEFEKDGVTDFILSNVLSDLYNVRIHSLVKDMSLQQ